MIDKYKESSYLKKLIQNNTGVSSKNFFLVALTLIGLLLLLVPVISLMIEVICNHTISTDLNGMAAYIAAVASIFATAGITKAWSEKWENKNNNCNKEHDCNTNEHSGNG